MAHQNDACSFQEIYKNFSYKFVFDCYDHNKDQLLDSEELKNAYFNTFLTIIQHAIRDESEDVKSKYSYKIYLFIVNRGKVPKSLLDKISMSKMSDVNLKITPYKITKLLDVLHAHLCKHDYHFKSGLCSTRVSF